MTIVLVVTHCLYLDVSKYVAPSLFSLQLGSSGSLHWGCPPRNTTASSSLRCLTNCSTALSSSLRPRFSETIYSVSKFLLQNQKDRCGMIQSCDMGHASLCCFKTFLNRLTFSQSLCWTRCHLSALLKI